MKNPAIGQTISIGDMNIVKTLWFKIKNKPFLFKYLLARLLMAMRMSHFFSIKRKDYSLKFFPTSMSAALWIDPKFRLEDDTFFIDFLKQGDIVIDAGANIGSLSLAAATRVGSGGKVLAFEPNPRIFEFLLENIKFNHHCHIIPYNMGLSNSQKNAYLDQPGRADDMATVSQLQNRTSLGIKLDTLEHILLNEGIKNIALLKIDVEGYEKFVLEGVGSLLPNVENLYFEVSEQNFQRYGYSTEDLFSLIRDYGFQIYCVDVNNKSVKLLASSDEEPLVINNLVAVRYLEKFLLRTGYYLLS